MSDISDHFSQFCFIHSLSLRSRYQGIRIRDCTKFSEENFIRDISQIDWVARTANDSVDRFFSSFYNKFNKIFNKHAPLKTISKRKAKQLSQPWISRGLRKSIKIKNSLFLTGDPTKYKLYRNKISSLIKTWEGINTLINKKRHKRTMTSLQFPNNQRITRNQSEIANTLNRHFAWAVGKTRIGPDRIGSDRIGSDRIGSDRIGSDRIGPDRINKGPRQKYTHVIPETFSLV